VANPTQLNKFTMSGNLGVSSVAFSPDGTKLATADGNGNGNKAIIILWDMNVNSLIAKACQRAGHNFTQAEWTQYFPNKLYRKTCEQWPAGN